MKRYRMLVILGGFSLLVGCGSVEPAELMTGEKETIMSESVKEVIVTDSPLVSSKDSLWEFSHRLFVENMNENNPVLSPVSAYLAMGMVGLGAENATLDEFQSVMGADMHEISEGLMQILPKGTMGEKDSTDTVLALANSVWVDDIMEPTQNWLNEVSAKYAAEAYRTDLSAKNTVRRINDWIDKKTNGMITEFLREPLSQDTCLALFNSIYFYGQWQSTFMANNTYKDTFTREDGTEVQVDMMHKNRTNIYYVQQDDLDGVILPYRDGDTAFVALKPTAGQTVREMYEGLTGEAFKDLLYVDGVTYANLKLPKFEVTFDKILNDSLKNMGLVSAFDARNADFSGLGSTGGKNLFISLVRQKAVIRVDEKGTEAAAVTGVMVKSTSAMPEKQPVEVFFDEPFLYMIVDLKSQTLLFMGIMDCPE